MEKCTELKRNSRWAHERNASTILNLNVCQLHLHDADNSTNEIFQLFHAHILFSNINCIVASQGCSKRINTLANFGNDFRCFETFSYAVQQKKIIVSSHISDDKFYREFILVNNIFVVTPLLEKFSRFCFQTKFRPKICLLHISLYNQRQANRADI